MITPARLKRLCNLTFGFALFSIIFIPVIFGFFTGFAVPLPFPSEPIDCVISAGVATGLALATSIPCLLHARTRNSIIWAAPRFVRGVASSVRAGLPLQEAIERVARTGIYGVLGRLMLRAMSRVKAGVDFDRALMMSVREADDPVVHRLATLLVEAYGAGPKASEVLDASAEYFTTLEEFLLLREAAVRPYMTIVYMMFGIYLFIVYIIVNVMLTALTSGQLPFHVAVTPKEVAVMFFWQSYVSSIAAGLFLGKVSYNSAKAGLFHASILSLMSLTFFALFVFGPVRIPLGPTPNITGGAAPTPTSP